jgi:hypothetical protein
LDLIAAARVALGGKPKIKKNKNKERKKINKHKRSNPYSVRCISLYLQGYVASIELPANISAARAITLTKQKDL